MDRAASNLMYTMQPSRTGFACACIRLTAATLGTGGRFPYQINRLSGKPTNNIGIQFLRSHSAAEHSFFKRFALRASPSDQSLLITIEELRLRISPETISM